MSDTPLKITPEDFLLRQVTGEREHHVTEMATRMVAVIDEYIEENEVIRSEVSAAILSVLSVARARMQSYANDQELRWMFDAMMERPGDG